MRGATRALVEAHRTEVQQAINALQAQLTMHEKAAADVRDQLAQFQAELDDVQADLDADVNQSQRGDGDKPVRPPQRQ